MRIEIETNDLVSVSDAAKLLGIPRITIYKRIEKGKLKHIKLGSNIYIPRDELGERHEHRKGAKGD